MIQIITGILALGVVIFVHELGHFIAARLCGVTVETFSLGWGPVLLRHKIGDTEYRLSAFPIGGYCGLKGENAFRDALDKKLDAIPREAHSFFAAHPLKRMIISFSGPFANVLFAFLALALVSAVGYEYKTSKPVIIPTSLYMSGAPRIAEDAGLAEGDLILSVNDTRVNWFSDLQRIIASRPGETLIIEYERSGVTGKTQVVPELDPKTGSGRIGISNYIPLEIEGIKAGSAAETAGLRVGDIVLQVNGIPVTHTVDFARTLSDKPEQITLTVNRNGLTLRYQVLVLYEEDVYPNTGIEWKSVTVKVDGTDFVGSVITGAKNTWELTYLTIKSLGLLFRGVDLSEAVSGPVRITMMIGEVAESGITNLLELLAVVCISLFLMNLLPIPILDGGQIVISAVEMIKRKPLKPLLLFRIQTVGMGFIFVLFLFALVNDIGFLLK